MSLLVRVGEATPIKSAADLQEVSMVLMPLDTKITFDSSDRQVCVDIHQHTIAEVCGDLAQENIPIPPQFSTAPPHQILHCVWTVWTFVL